MINNYNSSLMVKQLIKLGKYNILLIFSLMVSVFFILLSVFHLEKISLDDGEYKGLVEDIYYYSSGLDSDGKSQLESILSSGEVEDFLLFRRAGDVSFLRENKSIFIYDLTLVSGNLDGLIRGNGLDIKDGELIADEEFARDLGLVDGEILELEDSQLKLRLVKNPKFKLMAKGDELETLKSRSTMLDILYFTGSRKLLSQYKIFTLDQWKESQIGSRNRGLFVVSLLYLFFISLSACNLLLVYFGKYEKLKKDLAIMRLQGASKKDITVLIVGENLILLFFAFVLMLLVTSLFNGFIDKYVNFRLTSLGICISLVLSVILTSFSSWIQVNTIFSNREIELIGGSN